MCVWQRAGQATAPTKPSSQLIHCQTLMSYSAKTILLKVDPFQPESDLIARAAQVIREGGLVAFPTETVYGLGANALDAEAVLKIFAAKERPANDPLIVHLASINDLPLIARDIPQATLDIANVFMPGALTLIFRRQATVPDAVTAGQDTVAVRVPSHPVAQALIRASGTPIAAPSANRFSRPSPTSAAHVLSDLGGRVDIVLDGGSATIGVESTILDLSRDVPTILRPGGISLEALREFLPDVVARTFAIQEDEIAPVPGTLLKHYSPNADVLLFTGSHLSRLNDHIIATANDFIQGGRKVGILYVGASDEFSQTTALLKSLGDNSDQAAAHLYEALRSLEQSVETILVRAPDQIGLGLALWDRLWRAAEGRIIYVE